MPVSAVIFDMDGLMLDTERISRQVWRLAALELGLMLDDEISERMVGLNEVSSRALLVDHFGPDWPVDDLAALAQIRYREHLDTHGVPRKPGLEALLEFLTARRIPKAVATSTVSVLARHKLQQAGVFPYFDVIVGGDEVVHGKPAPDIYLLAAKRLGQDPARCVVLEDSRPGILAAAAAGMTPVMVPDGREPSEDARRVAYSVVESLDEARELLERLINDRRIDNLKSEIDDLIED